jgi:hypothetical protein
MLASQLKKSPLPVATFALAVLAGCQDAGPSHRPEEITTVTRAIVETVLSPKTINGLANGQPIVSVNHWETVALAVPPNRGNCGSSGAVFFRPSNTKTADDVDGWGKMWKASLSCLRGTGSSCDATVRSVGGPIASTALPRKNYKRGSTNRPQTYYQGGHDARLVRLMDDTLLLQTQGGGLASGHYDVRSAHGFWVSRDCGETWTLQSVLDPKYDFANGIYHDRSGMAGLDYPFLHVDPWRGWVYTVLKGQGDLHDHLLIFVSKDGAKTWTMLNDPANPIPRWGQRMTTLAGGEAVLFACEAGTPTLRIYDPTTNQINLAGTIGDVCSMLPGLRDANMGITRVFNGTEQRVRVMYPQVQGGTRQGVVVRDVRFSSGGLGGVFLATTITATSSVGSVIHATLIEPDYLDVSMTNSTNPGLIYWIENDNVAPLAGNHIPKAMIFNTDGPSTRTLDTGFTSFMEQGDYLMGGFYYDSAVQKVGFVAPWHTNFGTTLRAAVVEWPEANLVNCPTPSGATNVCTSACPCLEGQADCSSSGCNVAHGGLVCGVNIGPNYGYPSTADVCVPPACNPNPNAPQTPNYCTSVCRCAAGFGDCDSDSGCLPGLVCGRNNGAAFGMSASWDVCVPSHCTDRILSGNETSVDRGGSCGSSTCPLAGGFVGEYCKGGLGQGICDQDSNCNDPALGCINSVCSCKGADENGGGAYCSAVCPCSEGRGFCRTNADCASGLICSGRELGGDVAGLYGMASNIRDAYLVEPYVWKDAKVCVPSTCATGRSQAGSALATPGHADFCTTQCRCARGFGACTSNSECLPGLNCVSGMGPNFGLSADTDVCVPNHCINQTRDADETFTDCGGRDCGACDQPVSRWDRFGSIARPLTMYRRSIGQWPEGTWSGTGEVRVSVGTRWDTPVYADVTGDGVLDRGLYREGSPFRYYVGGEGTVLHTSNVMNAPSTMIPTIGRYNVGATADVAYWDKNNFSWYAWDAASGNNVLPFPPGVTWGAAGDVPVPGDYDGDGRLDYAVFRPSTGQWFIRNTDFVPLWETGGVPRSWGQQGDIPIPGDYNGDGKSDLVVYRPARTPRMIEQGIAGEDLGRFWLLWNANGVITTNSMQWGKHMDVPVAGDFNADGRSDLCVYRPNNSQWYCMTSEGTGIGAAVWGEARPLWPPQ